MAQTVADLPTGPKDAKSAVLTLDEEAVIVAFRRHTLLPLDDCLYSSQPTMPHLTRSSLHRCLQRHDISRLPEVEGDKPAMKAFKADPLGWFRCADLRITLILLGFRRLRPSCISSSPSTAPPGSPSWNCTDRPGKWRQQPSCAI